jgi:predicted metalloprotease with PDZ domain
MEQTAANALDVSRPGRTWRPLRDTADAASFLYVAGGGWTGWRRTTDFYREGQLIWLEADVNIRQITGGRRSLDDFCAIFLGQGDNGRVYVKSYDVSEVYAALNLVAPYDWKRFFAERLDSKSANPPLGGVERGGYRLVFTAAANIFTDPWALDGGLNAFGSLGVHVTSDGTVDDAWPDRPAYQAGISNGMKIVAINGRKFSVDELKRALVASTARTDPLEFIVENGSYYSVKRVDYHGGLRYPHLERASGADDVLLSIVKARLTAQP